MDNQKLTLEQTILKLFKYSSNPNDKLFTDDIMSKIVNSGYEYPFIAKDIVKIILKANIGFRNLKGIITINKVRKAGYSNIIYVG